VHFYKFNISDYKSHTEHLEPLEDLAYRRMLDWCYLHEKPLPKEKKEIARMIRLRAHSDCIAIVLREFFDTNKDGEFIHKRVFMEIEKTNAKSSKARESAKARWDKVSSNANALQTESESNATQDPLHTTQDPLPKKKGFQPPSQKEVENYCFEKTYSIDAEAFICFYESKGWMVGKNKMKNWKAALTNWQKRGNNNGQKITTSRAKQHQDKLKEIAERDIKQNGYTDFLD